MRTTTNIIKTLSVPKNQNTFVQEFLEKLNKIETFLINSLDMLHNDIEILRKYEEKIDNENKIIYQEKNFKSIRPLDYEHDDSAIKDSFKYIYEMVTWLQDFCIVTEIGCQKLIDTYKKENNLTNKLDPLYIEIDKAYIDTKKIIDNIIIDEKNLKNELTEMYAERYTNKNFEKAKMKLLHFDYESMANKDKISLIFFIFMMILIFVSYFLLTYLPGNYNFNYFNYFYY